MNIEAFLLCDAATDQQGKLNILGAFNNIFSRKLPVVHPACSVAVRIRFEKIEEGDHSVKILIIDEDAKPIGPKMEGKVSIKIRPGMDSAVTNLIINFQGLKFEKYGKYRIDLAINGNAVAELPFAVIQPQN